MSILEKNNLFIYAKYLKNLPDMTDEKCNKEISEAMLLDPRFATEQGAIEALQQYFDDGFTKELQSRRTSSLVCDFVRFKYMRL